MHPARRGCKRYIQVTNQTSLTEDIQKISRKYFRKYLPIAPAFAPLSAVYGMPNNARKLY
jgi:hypothetical protein